MNSNLATYFWPLFSPNPTQPKLGPTQRQVLLEISKRSGDSSQLTERLGGMNIVTFLEVAKELSHHGLIERKLVDLARRRIVINSITPLGKELVRQIEADETQS